MGVGRIALRGQSKQPVGITAGFSATLEGEAAHPDIDVAARAPDASFASMAALASSGLSRVRSRVRAGLGAVALVAGLSASVAGIAACSPQTSPPVPADSESIVEIPLTVHVATQHGQPVVTDAQIVASIRRANQALAPFRVRVEVARMRTMSPGHSVIDGEHDRLELARRADRDGTLHVFFVDRVAMQDGDDPDARLSGLHWRYAGMRSQMHEREYLVVSGDAPNTTLAHEIGHAFGLDHHKSYENIMCSCRRGTDTHFTSRQGEFVRAGAADFLLRERP